MWGIYDPVEKSWLCALYPICGLEYEMTFDIQEALTFPTEIKAAAYLRQYGGLPFDVEIRKI